MVMGICTARTFRRFQPLLIHGVLILLSMLFLFPLLWMISTALKPIEQTMKLPPDFLPRPVLWENFPQAIVYMKYFWRYTFNTVFVCVMGVFGVTISCALAAYGFSRVQWRGRDLMFGLTLATMMIPGTVTVIPLYELFRALHWVGTLNPLWVPAFFGAAFPIFLLRQFFMGIPKDLTDAAMIDGCSHPRIFWSVIVPLAKPALVVVALFHFIWAWNDFFGPLIYLTKQETFTLSLGLQFFQSQHGGTQWHYLMAASTLVVAPVIALFFFAQKTFIQGIALTGIRE